MATNELYYGDNLDVLRRKVRSASVDLCYIDPLFNSKRNGINTTYQSIALILKRFADTYKDDWPAIEADILLDGVPKDLASAVALANRKNDKTRKEFEKWAVLTYSRNQARINKKGVDGIAYSLEDAGRNGKAFVNVTSRPGKRLDLPMARVDAVKAAAALGDAGKQATLL